MSRPPELGHPIISIQDAIAAGSFWDVPDLLQQQDNSSGASSSSGSSSGSSGSAPVESKASWGEALTSRPGMAAPLSGGIYLQQPGRQQRSGPGPAQLVQAVVRQAGDMAAAMARSTHRLEGQRWGQGCC